MRATHAGWANFVLVFTVCIGLFGCATIPRQAYNRDLNKEVKTIGLLQPAFSGEYAVQNLGHPGTSFGLIGALVAVADMQSKSTEFTVAAKDTKFDAVGEFTLALEKQLTAAGYNVRRIDVKREKQDFLDSYSSLDPGVDAYFDPVMLYVGYTSASAATPYLPSVRVRGRMVKRGGAEILYSELVIYGYQFTGIEAVNLPADSKYQFPNFSDLKANVPLAAEGVRVGLPLVADRFGTDLKRAAP